MRSRVVAVAGAKGSPGVSFVAAGLACRMAELGLAVLLVDADAEDLSLALLLDLARPEKRPAPPESGVLTPELLRTLALPVARNLELLELPAAASEPIDGRAVAGAAREAGFAAVVCDVGHHHRGLQKQLAAASDWLLWVVAPDRTGLDRADRALAAPSLRAGSAALVLNRLGVHTLRGAGPELSRRHELPVVAALREDRRSAAAASARRPWHRQRRFRAAFDDLAHSLHPDLAGRHREAWP